MPTDTDLGTWTYTEQDDSHNHTQDSGVVGGRRRIHWSRGTDSQSEGNEGLVKWAKIGKTWTMTKKVVKISVKLDFSKISTDDWILFVNIVVNGRAVSKNNYGSSFSGTLEVYAENSAASFNVELYTSGSPGAGWGTSLNWNVEFSNFSITDEDVEATPYITSADLSSADGWVYSETDPGNIWTDDGVVSGKRQFSIVDSSSLDDDGQARITKTLTIEPNSYIFFKGENTGVKSGNCPPSVKLFVGGVQKFYYELGARGWKWYFDLIDAWALQATGGNLEIKIEYDRVCLGRSIDLDISSFDLRIYKQAPPLVIRGAALMAQLAF